MFITSAQRAPEILFEGTYRHKQLPPAPYTHSCAIQKWAKGGRNFCERRSHVTAATR